MFFMAVMAVAAVAGAASSANAASAAGSAERGRIDQNIYNQQVQQSFNEETLKTDILKAEMNFQSRYIGRLTMYNQILDQQVLSAGYKGTTINTNIQASDEKAWERDNVMDHLNSELERINLNLGNAQTNLGMAQNTASADAARAASKTAESHAQTGAMIQGISGVASAGVKYGQSKPSTPPASTTTQAQVDFTRSRL